jgi:hypothetical protein
VLGTVTEIPAVFAGRFPQCFFDEFFQGGIDQSGKALRSVGHVMFELRRRFLDVHNNPLGLLYTVYYGADAYLEKAMPKKSG